MRRLVILLAAAASVAACNRIGVRDPEPYRSGNTTSIVGTWVLDTPADSTAFMGARRVDLTLDSTSFVITAHYPTNGPVVIRGSAARTEAGELVLTPTSSTASTDRSRALVFAANQPITFLASASGGTLIFSPPLRGYAIPSSVWHRRSAAEAAGEVVTDSTP
jgi:hypothetical protein